MINIYHARQGVKTSSRDGLIAAMCVSYTLGCIPILTFYRYLLNPYLFLPSLALSSSSIENTLVLLSVMFACQRTSLPKSCLYRLNISTDKPSQTLLAYAFLLQISLSSLLFLAPLLLLLITDPFSRLASPRAFYGDLKKLPPLLGEFAVYFVSLTLASTLVSGGFSWIGQTWGARSACSILSSLVSE